MIKSLYLLMKGHAQSQMKKEKNQWLRKQLSQITEE